jgi:thiamine kinase-like enzyme
LLEWADGRPGEFWPVADNRPAAEALGRAQARFLLGRELPPVPWLSRGLLRAYSSEKPASLCHLDFWPKNLFRRPPDGQIVLIDWAFAGLGAVGEDAGNLVPGAVLDHFVPAADMPALEQGVYGGYLAGLHAAGWRDDPRLVRLGMWSSSVKYDSMAAFKLRERSRALLFNAGWARQALDVAGELGR